MPTKKNGKLFARNKTLKAIDKQLTAEIDWIREWQELYGDILIDPVSVAVGKQNTHLKRLFELTKLNRNNTDHWKFLLSILIETAYQLSKPGRPTGSVERSLEGG